MQAGIPHDRSKPGRERRLACPRSMPADQPRWRLPRAGSAMLIVSSLPIRPAGQAWLTRECRRKRRSGRSERIDSVLVQPVHRPAGGTADLDAVIEMVFSPVFGAGLGAGLVAGLAGAPENALLTPMAWESTPALVMAVSRRRVRLAPRIPGCCRAPFRFPECKSPTMTATTARRIKFPLNDPLIRLASAPYAR